MARQVFRSLHLAAFALLCASFSTSAVAQTTTKPAPMAGTWNVSIIGDHVIPVALVLEQDGASLKGTLMMMGKDIPMAGELTGSSFTLAGKAAVAMQQHAGAPPSGAAASSAPAASTSLKLTGTITENGTLAGEFASPNGAMKFTAERLRQRTASTGQPAAAAATFAGDWTMTLMAEPAAVVGTLALQQSGATLAGTYTSEHLGVLRIAGTAGDGKVTFTADGQAHGQDVHMEFIGSVKADGSVAGDLTSLMGPMTWTALRLKK